MTNAKNSHAENPLIYYTIILLAVGVVAYKWFNEVDKTILINTLIQLIIAVLIFLWFLAIIIFSYRRVVLGKAKAKTISKILLHITNIIIIGLFIYRISRPHTISTSVILHGLIALILFMYYNYNIPKTVIRLREDYNIKKQYALTDRNEIRGFIRTNLDNMGIDELKHKKEYFKNKEYSDKALNQFQAEFNSKLQELTYTLKKKLLESEIYRIKMLKNTEQKELDKIQQEKNEILIDENSKKAVKEYKLTHRDENVILSQRLTKEEKNILRKSKHKQVNEYCAHQKKNSHSIRQTNNESFSNTHFLSLVC